MVHMTVKFLLLFCDIKEALGQIIPLMQFLLIPMNYELEGEHTAEEKSLVSSGAARDHVSPTSCRSS